MPDFNSTFGQLLFSTVLLKSRKECGLVEFGTGFAFDYTENGRNDSFIVTCRHVVSGSSETKIDFTCQQNLPAGQPKKPDVGNRKSVAIGSFNDCWYAHPDGDVDLAILPYSVFLDKTDELAIYPYMTSLNSSDVISPAKMALLDVRETIAYVGYPYGHHDTTNFLPLIRSGWTASWIDLNFGSLPGFYVDAHFHPGSSGSPVLLIDKTFATDPVTGSASYHAHDYVLGVATSADIAKSGPFKDHETGLGFVTHGAMIIDTIERFLKVGMYV